MTSCTPARLRELDDTGWESPRDFNFEAEMARVACVKPDVETIIGHTLRQDRSVQDASFFTELAWLDEEFYTPGKGGALVPHIAVRFSCFGKMATVYSGNGDKKDLMRLAPQIGDALTRHGFLYVSRTALDEPYPGGESWMSGWTWFSRFFDYL